MGAVKYRLCWLVVGAVALAGTGFPSLAGAASDVPFDGSGMAYTSSSDWAGLLMSDGGATGLGGAVGVWAVPRIDCSQKGTAGVSEAVGTGGAYAHGAPVAKQPAMLEASDQAGVTADCRSGKATYWAWDDASGKADPVRAGAHVHKWDGTTVLFPPVAPRRLHKPVEPGDTVRVTIAEQGNVTRWTIKVAKGKKHLWTGDGTWRTGSPLPHTAECVTEPPFMHHRFVPLADFGQVQFTTCDAVDQQGAVHPMVETAATLPATWRLLFLQIKNHSHPTVAAPVVPATSPPAVLWLSPHPKALPAISATTSTGDQLLSLLEKSGLWPTLRSSHCAQPTLQVAGATFERGAADIGWVETCTAMWYREFKIRTGTVRAFNDVYDGPATSWYLPFPLTANSQPATFAITGAGLAPATSPVATTTTPTSTTPPSATAPTLGLDWPTSGGGYGSAAPEVVSNGGDPTGVVTGITWQSWGGAEAIGTGTGSYLPPNAQTVAGTAILVPATIVAFDLGSCGGHPAYQEVSWYFPTEGETFKPGTAIDACTYGQSAFIGQGQAAAPSASPATTPQTTPATKLATATSATAGSTSATGAAVGATTESTATT